MSRHRSGELGAVPLRSSRFLMVDDKWYFCCREGRDQGPFPSKAAAEAALQSYLTELNSLSELAFPATDGPTLQGQ